MISKFYSVCGAEQASQCKTRYPNFSAARDEAARLAKKEGEAFYVLEAIGCVTPIDEPIKYISLQDK